ncbi:hypothetical protein [Sphingomonas pruni]|uniref:hypothetical protein n=1 Tax=Sphingomonas pruni TaxID=40683 RepID=UPI000AE78338|nr:hypothetical protein [Sphingomonas pruni]
MTRTLAIALLGALPSVAFAQTEKVDITPVQSTAGVSVVIARPASKTPVADARGAYAFVNARSVAGAPLSGNIDVTLPSPPKGGDGPVIMLIVASPSGSLTAKQVIVAKKGRVACAPIDWFAENGLSTGPGAIITFPPKDICFPTE